MAATAEGVIGLNNGLPWNLPQELEFLRQMTKDQVVVLGRKTFDTIPSSFFNNRFPIIFSKDAVFTTSIKHHLVNCIEDFLSLIPTFPNQKIFMIGGAEIANLFLKMNLISEFYLSQIHGQYTGDTYLDLQLFYNWQKEIVASNNDYIIFKLTNPQEPKLC